MKEGLLSRVVGAVLAEVEADRSAVLVAGEDGNPRVLLAKGIDMAGNGEECRAAAAQVMKSGQPMIVRNAPAFPGNRASCVLCFPLICSGKPAGALYLDKEPPAAAFSAHDVEFLAAAGGFISRLLPNGFPGREWPGNGSLIGREGGLRKVREIVEKVKNSTAPVFISGESGTGKELVARTIHETGSRRSGKFVAVNCGAIPDPLLESELFGYARGAFTGAARDRAGLIEEAHGGTFFLDEVGDLPLHLQAKLLRMLEERSIRRLGENRIRPVDVRFVSATNRDLDRAVREGGFREDLYYRLKIISIELPPLRERTEDLMLLINHFTEHYSREMNRPRPYFAPDAIDLLCRYPWPGNVRELQNEVQRCLIMAGESSLIREDHLSPALRPDVKAGPPPSRGLAGGRAEFERRFLLEALARCEFSRTRTAAEIGITRQGLFKLMKKHGIDAPRGAVCLPDPFAR
jgi:transcriptional regulator with AAA-type ATPase domain